MLTRHVEHILAAYHHGELPVGASRRVAEHLLECRRCRAANDEIRFAATMAGSLATVEAPDELWAGIESQIAAKPAEARPRQRFFWMPYAAAAAVLIVALGTGLVWYLSRASGPGWTVVARGGAPRIGTNEVGDGGRLGLGETVVTDGGSRAEIRVGAIGTVDVEPNSSVRLVEASMTEHRLALDRGTLSARIWAPPRLFFVDTPSAVAVDYGCAYTLSVDDAGAGLLRVTSGWVALERGGRESLVPAGAMCATRPGHGPGTPYFEDASDPLRTELARYDFEAGGGAALGTVLAAARPRDSLTLWYLLSSAARSTVGGRSSNRPGRALAADRVLLRGASRGMETCMRKVVKWSLVVLGVPLLLIQLVRPERANPQFDPAWSIESRTHMPAEVAAIIDRSCKDCHSNETRWPWYSNLAPVSWLVADDVKAGRRQLNFSEWARYSQDEADARLTYIAFAARERTMPKPSYLRLHPSARLSDEEIETLSRWVDEQTTK